MEALGNWFVRITGILILSALCEGVLPSGNIKKYVRILFGLILTIAICSPFLRGMTDDFDIEVERYEAFSEIEKMEGKERETVLRLYKANLARRMNSELKGVFPDCEFEFQLEVEMQNMQEFGEIRGVIITVVTDDESLYINDEVEEIISGTYGVSRKNIAVKYTGK